MREHPKLYLRLMKSKKKLIGYGKGLVSIKIPLVLLSWAQN